MKIRASFNKIKEKTIPTQISYSPPVKSGYTIIIIVSMMIFFGLIMLYSTSNGIDKGASYIIKQSVWIFGGIFLSFFINLFGYKNVLPFSKYLIIITSILLIAVLFSRPINGAYRWIPLPGGYGNIQPSELAKITVVMFLAYYLPKYEREMRNKFIQFLLPLLIVGFITVLVLIGKDLGTTALICAVIWFMIFAAGIRWKLILLPIPLLCLAPDIIKFTSDVRWARVTSFLDPEKFQQTTGYQLWLSILALGSGGWYGLGLGKSRMKAEYLPEAHTDFILSIVGEELGLIVMLLIILGYVIIITFGIYISTRAKEKDGMLLAFGVTIMIALQAFINIGVVSGFLPTKGMPAPFISYGGSNIIVCIVGIGLLLSVANYKGKEK